MTTEADLPRSVREEIVRRFHAGDSVLGLSADYEVSPTNVEACLRAEKASVTLERDHRLEESCVVLVEALTKRMHGELPLCDFKNVAAGIRDLVTAINLLRNGGY